MSRVLVTGATGFVGSHVAEALEAGGHALRCTVRESSDTRWLDGLDAERVRVDLASPGSLGSVMSGVEAVVHVAGVTRSPRQERYHEVNVGGTVALARAAVAAGVRRFVFLSSLAARGPDGAEGPVSTYGVSKRQAEERLRSLEDDLPVTVLRPGAVYGPRDTDLLPLFRMARRGWLAAPLRGAPLQPVYADDVARAARAALETEVPFGPFPLAEDARYDWRRVAEAMEAAVGGQVRLVRLPAAFYLAAGAVAEGAARLLGRAAVFDRRRARDVSRHGWTCDPSPTREELGWSARVALPEGLERTAAWYREQGWL